MSAQVRGQVRVKLSHMNRWPWPRWGSGIKGSFVPWAIRGWCYQAAVDRRSRNKREPVRACLCIFAGFCSVFPKQRRQVVEALSWRRGPSHRQPPTDLIVFQDPCIRQLEATGRTSKRAGVDRQACRPRRRASKHSGPSSLFRMQNEPQASLAGRT